MNSRYTYNKILKQMLNVDIHRLNEFSSKKNFICDENNFLIPLLFSLRLPIDYH